MFADNVFIFEDKLHRFRDDGTSRGNAYSSNRSLSSFT